MFGILINPLLKDAEKPLTQFAFALTELEQNCTKNKLFKKKLYDVYRLKRKIRSQRLKAALKDRNY